MGKEGGHAFLNVGGRGFGGGVGYDRQFFGEADLEGEGGSFAAHDKVLGEESVQAGEACSEFAHLGR